MSPDINVRKKDETVYDRVPIIPIPRGEVPFDCFFNSYGLCFGLLVRLSFVVATRLSDSVCVISLTVGERVFGDVFCLLDSRLSRFIVSVNQ